MIIRRKTLPQNISLSVCQVLRNSFHPALFRIFRKRSCLPMRQVRQKSPISHLQCWKRSYWKRRNGLCLRRLKCRSPIFSTKWSETAFFAKEMRCKNMETRLEKALPHWKKKFMREQGRLLTSIRPNSSGKSCFKNWVFRVVKKQRPVIPRLQMCSKSSQWNIRWYERFSNTGRWQN